MDTVAIAAGQWRMVFPESLYKRLRAHLFPGDGDEHAAVIAAGLARSPAGEMRLLARNLFLATDARSDKQLYRTMFFLGEGQCVGYLPRSDEWS